MKIIRIPSIIMVLISTFSGVVAFMLNPYFPGWVSVGFILNLVIFIVVVYLFTMTGDPKERLKHIKKEDTIQLAFNLLGQVICIIFIVHGISSDFFRFIVMGLMWYFIIIGSSCLDEHFLYIFNKTLCKQINREG